MRKILAGIETEYGLLVSDRGAEQQVEDSRDMVRAYPGNCFVGWDYRYESPRADLRGFRLERLAFDPEDAKFDRGRTYGPDQDIRSDRILPNGARLYNDHGHPEYSTPECLSILELARHDCAGQIAVWDAARAHALNTGFEVQVYKNNTDFHGASYGTHESYLSKREGGFERLFRDLTPMLVARQVLVGAGKVGSETGPACTYQISQRADFFVEPANAETLYRRPIFNTRDEPHSEHSDWIRIHVICGDANMISTATARKAGLVKLAIALSEIGEAPQWKIPDPVGAFQTISRDERYEFPVSLGGKNWTNAWEILESYFAAAERFLDLDAELRWVIDSSRGLFESIRTDFQRFAQNVDWAAKYQILKSYLDSEGTDWRDPALRSFDLEYCSLDTDGGLHGALEQMGEVEPNPPPEQLMTALESVTEPTRARARSIAVTKFSRQLKTACWKTLTFEVEGKPIEVDLPPDADYSAQLLEISDVGTFIEALRGIK